VDNGLIGLALLHLVLLQTLFALLELTVLSMICVTVLVLGVLILHVPSVIVLMNPNLNTDVPIEEIPNVHKAMKHVLILELFVHL
jgi:hypothetical protein